MTRAGVRAWGPASLSNLGPGFDAIGVCLQGLGDVVEVTRSQVSGVRPIPAGGPWTPPMDVESNTAARAVRAVLQRLIRDGVEPEDAGAEVRVTKGILPGSGLGSSAASAVAGAWAAVHLFDGEPDSGLAATAALEGEAAVSGALHGDNVMPSLLGGVVLVAPGDAGRWRRLEVPAPMSLAIVRPDVEVLTRVARAMLPDRVPLRDAVHNAAALAFLVDALRAGDLVTAGEVIEQDRLVEPVRATLVPGFGGIRAAAREAGAFGCALSGSGPAIFAICRDRDSAETVMEAMREASARSGHAARGVVSCIDDTGARLATNEEPTNLI